MQNKDLFLGLAVVVLLIITITLGIRSATSTATAEEAYQMSDLLVQTLREEGYHRAVPECRQAQTGRYASINTCLEAIRTTRDLTGFFDEDNFQNINSRRPEGFIVIENAEGRRTFASSNFTLLHNNEPVASGCTTSGDIAPGFTCRLNLARECLEGDNLEITYNGNRAHLRTC